MNEITERLTKRLRSPKALIIIGFVGILLIFLSTLGKDSQSETPDTATEEISVEQYRLSLEKDITEMVRTITGSRKVTVVVTLDSSIRYSYADIKEESSKEETLKENKTSDSELKSGYITVKTADGGEKALIVTTQMPEIRGVAVVCQGGDDEALKEKIKNAVTSALNITSQRVYICGRNN